MTGQWVIRACVFENGWSTRWAFYRIGRILCTNHTRNAQVGGNKADTGLYKMGHSLPKWGHWIVLPFWQVCPGWHGTCYACACAWGDNDIHSQLAYARVHRCEGHCQWANKQICFEYTNTTIKGYNSLAVAQQSLGVYGNDNHFQLGCVHLDTCTFGHSVYAHIRIQRYIGLTNAQSIVNRFSIYRGDSQSVSHRGTGARIAISPIN